MKTSVTVQPRGAYEELHMAYLATKTELHRREQEKDHLLGVIREEKDRQQKRREFREILRQQRRDERLNMLKVCGLAGAAFGCVLSLFAIALSDSPWWTMIPGAVMLAQVVRKGWK